jgi:transcriptional regulator with XRE-family HTH domain
MDDAALGAAIRALRHRRGWRQLDLAARAGVSPSVISVLEAGHADRLSLPAIRRVSGALDLRLRWDAGFRGSELARLRDADHARTSEAVIRRLEGQGWQAMAEVSFNNYGERGRIDVLAYHPAARMLVVIEIKTLIVEVQAILGGLSVKQRVAPAVARSMGWRPATVVPALVVSEGATNRRRLAEHERLFARLTLRGRAAMTWLRAPVGAPEGLLILLDSSNHSHADVRRAGRQRVRVRTARPRSSKGANSGSVSG